MIVDTSAVVAILRDEPESRRFSEAIRDNKPPRISAGTFLELAIVADQSRSPELSSLLDEFIVAAAMDIEPVTASQVIIAREAHRRFGRGSGHPARLNVGDCFAYALARERNEPLLFKGNDFGHTDIDAAV